MDNKIDFSFTTLISRQFLKVIVVITERQADSENHSLFFSLQSRLTELVKRLSQFFLSFSFSAHFP